MSYLDKVSYDKIIKFIIDCIMEYSGCTKAQAEEFYKIAMDIDIDLLERFDEELENEFGDIDDGNDDWYPERDDEWCHKQGIM